MKNTFSGIYVLFLVILLFTGSSLVQAQKIYFPSKGVWTKKRPSQLRVDKAKLTEAINFAKKSEASAPKDQELGQARSFGREPFGEAVGPFKTRGEMTGVIIKNGYIVAEWGEPFRVDMTHSVTKSFLSATIGLAYDRKLIRNLKALVYKEMAPVSAYNPLQRFDDPTKFGKSKFLDIFATKHNKLIDWNSLLRQTSDWEGSLWGKPDWADRPSRDRKTWLTRERKAPGEVFEYNDTRVNLLALAALNVWRKPLPQVLKHYIMDEIGASQTWRWHGYENSYVLIDGQIIQSVSGGGHWGGGMFINARDMARFGYLILRNGKWKNKQILSKRFLKMAETPTKARVTYGFMNFFLNTEKKMYKSAPADTIAFLGNGTNMIYIDRKNDLVIVARWIENRKIDEFLGKIYESIK